MTRKLNLKFETQNEQNDKVVANALLTQLMVTITQIGIRVDNPPEENCSKIEKETKHVKNN